MARCLAIWFWHIICILFSELFLITTYFFSYGKEKIKIFYQTTYNYAIFIKKTHILLQDKIKYSDYWPQNAPLFLRFCIVRKLHCCPLKDTIHSLSLVPVFHHYCYIQNAFSLIVNHIKTPYFDPLCYKIVTVCEEFLLKFVIKEVQLYSCFELLE
jgi:hypothetical protein